MGGAYGMPCSGELQFWAVMQAQMREQSKQLERIANALEAGHAHEGRPVAVDCAKLREVLGNAMDIIDAWRTESSMEHFQYSQLFDLLNSALATIPEGGAK